MSVFRKSRAIIMVGLFLASGASGRPNPENVPIFFHAIPDTVTIASGADLARAIVALNGLIRSAETQAEAIGHRKDYVGVYPDPMFMISRQPVPVMTAMGKTVLELGVEQMIPYPGKPSLMRKMADVETMIGFDQAQMLAVETVFEAQITLNDIQKFHRIREVILAFQNRLDGYEVLAIRKYEVGEGNQQEVLKLQLENAQLDQKLLELTKAIEASTLSIARLIQQPVLIELPKLNAVEAAEAEIDFASRSDLRLLSHARELATSQHDLLTYYNRPDFAVKLGWMGIVASDMPGASEGKDVFTVGLGVRIPIGQAANKARIQENSLQIQAIDEQLESSKRTIEALFLEVQALKTYDQELVEHIEKSLLPSADALLETSVLSYSNGQGELLDLLDSERTRFQLATEKVEIVGRIGESQLMLDRISGRLNRLVTAQF